MPISGIVPSEILEGPDAIRATLAGAEGPARSAAVALRDQAVRRVWVIGNGTSYHSSFYLSGLARRCAEPEDPIVIAVTAGEFLTFRPRLNGRDAIVGISASGEFRDVVRIFDEVRGSVPTVAVVHVPGSTLTRMADHVVVSAGGPSRVPVMTKTFSATLTAAAMVLAALLGDDVFAAVTGGLRQAAGHAATAIADAFPLVEELAGLLVGTEHLFVVGGGLAYPAAMEAALKLKEMALVHAEAAETWEMASGPATMVGPHTAVISLAPDGPARAAIDDVMRHCAEWGARIVEVAPTRSVADAALLPLPAEADERFAPLTAVPPVALLAYVLAGLRGATPDRPSWTERYHSQGLRHIVGV
jgi:glucosamine--fructose-6-phosphate aminotransferase (isomerizing)